MRLGNLLLCAAAIASSACHRTPAGTHGATSWNIRFTTPDGWSIEQTSDTATLLEVRLFDPAFEAKGDRVMEKKSEVLVRISSFVPASARGKAVATAGTIGAMVANPKLDSIDDVMPRYRGSYVPLTIDGIPMMRGPSEAHMGPLNMSLEYVIGFRGDTWVEIRGESEQTNTAAIASTTKAVDTVASSLTIKDLR